MPRKPRLHSPGGLYHDILRGKNRQDNLNEMLIDLSWEVLSPQGWKPSQLSQHRHRLLVIKKSTMNHLIIWYPTDVYYGRGREILGQREAIKLNTLAMRREMYYDNRNNLNLMS